MATPKQTDPQFKLRLTPELKNSIETAASANNRSMNAEIVARLEESFRVWLQLSLSQDLAERIMAAEPELQEEARFLATKTAIGTLEKLFPQAPSRFHHLAQMSHSFEKALASSGVEDSDALRERFRLIVEELQPSREGG